MKIAKAISGAAIALLSWTLPTATSAQEPAWKPSKTVTIVVPFAAGGGSDAYARAVARQLGVIWGTPVIVENMPGADGAIGARRVADARPDGHMILLHQPTLAVMKLLPSLKGYDPLAQLTPVTMIAEPGVAIATSSKTPMKSVQEMIKYCKANPCSIATVTTQSRSLAKQIGEDAGIKDFVVANYKGASAMVPDVLAGNVTLMFTSVAATLPFVKTGAMTVLATMGSNRSSVLPNVATVTEQGYPQFDMPSWNGLFVPKGTPDAAVDAIAAAVKKAIADPEVANSIRELGAEPIADGPKAFAQAVKQSEVKNTELFRRFPLK